MQSITYKDYKKINNFYQYLSFMMRCKNQMNNCYCDNGLLQFHRDGVFTHSISYKPIMLKLKKLYDNNDYWGIVVDSLDALDVLSLSCVSKELYRSIRSSPIQKTLKIKLSQIRQLILFIDNPLLQQNLEHIYYEMTLLLSN